MPTEELFAQAADDEKAPLSVSDFSVTDFANFNDFAIGLQCIRYCHIEYPTLTNLVWRRKSPTITILDLI
jgi:hypothetical protein